VPVPWRLLPSRLPGAEAAHGSHALAAVNQELNRSKTGAKFDQGLFDQGLLLARRECLRLERPPGTPATVYQAHLQKVANSPERPTLSASRSRRPCAGRSLPWRRGSRFLPPPRVRVPLDVAATPKPKLPRRLRTSRIWWASGRRRPRSRKRSKALGAQAGVSAKQMKASSGRPFGA